MANLLLADSFLVHVILAFIAGGVGVGMSTYTARRYSSGIGGLIGGLPSVSSITFFFIGLNQSITAASQATVAFPLGMSFTFLFLLVYATLSKRGFKPAMTLGLVAWFSLSTVETYVHLQILAVSIGVLASVFALSLYLYSRKLNLTYQKGTGGDLSAKRFAAYAIPGGTVVAAAVYLSQLLGTTAGGISAAFPAVFSSTLTFTYLSDGGMNLSLSMTKPLMLTAMTAAFPYSILVGLLYPLTGLYFGTLVAIIADLPFALLAYSLIHKQI